MAREGKGAGVTSFLGPGCFYSLDIFTPPTHTHTHTSHIPYYQLSLTQDGSCCSNPNLPALLQSDPFPVASKYLPVYFFSCHYEDRQDLPVSTFCAKGNRVLRAYFFVPLHAYRLLQVGLESEDPRRGERLFIPFRR